MSAASGWAPGAPRALVAATTAATAALSSPRMLARAARAGLAMAFALGAGVGASHARDGAPQSLHAEVLDAVVLPAVLPGGQRLREVSGLAWDTAAHQLISVSDRGLVVRWMLDVDRRRIVSAWPLQARPLLPNERVNAESVDVRPAAGSGPGRLPAGPRHLLVVDEARHRLLEFDAQGQVVAAGLLPGHAPAVKAAGRHAGDGVEAMAWHPRYGVLTIRQQPEPEDQAAGRHRVVAADGRTWTLGVTAGGRARIKAMHRLDDGRLLILERVNGGASRRLLLRELDLQACTADATCHTATAELDTRAFSDDDSFEGLACLDDRLCLIASDDGGRSQPRSVLGLLLLTRGSRAPAP